MNGFDKLRQLTEDIQKNRPEPVRSRVSDERAWFDVFRVSDERAWFDVFRVSDERAWFDVLKRIDEPPPVSPQRYEPRPEASPANPAQQAEPAQQPEPNRTPKQKAIVEFANERWPKGNIPITNRVRKAMAGSEVWRCIAAKHGVSKNPPDWKTINTALGRGV